MLGTNHISQNPAKFNCIGHNFKGALFQFVHTLLPTHMGHEEYFTKIFENLA